MGTKLLTADEEIALAIRIRAGDRAARDQFIEANVRLVRHLARRHRPGNAEDAAQDGMIGLIAAVDRFDPGRGCRFSTMASPWIRNAIQRGMQVHDQPSLNEESEFGDGERGDDVEDPADQIDPALCAVTAATMLDRLNADDRWLVARRYGLDDQPETGLRDLARELGVPASTLADRLAAARRRMAA